MTVAELIERIIDAYPGAAGPAMGTFRQAYADRLRRHEGPGLTKAATAVFASFKPTHRQPFPIPIDFEQHLPSGRLELPREGQKLDFKAHRQRKEAVIAEWFEGQGNALVRGVKDLWLAFDLVVQPLAYRMAWAERPGQLRLKPAEVVAIQQRAISQRRRLEHGPPPANAELWWDQIVEVMQRWDLDIPREQWTAAETTWKQSQPIQAASGIAA